MPKPTITRTYAPIHFEDLEPHRFEDLVRELMYDFRDWQTIEATGRSGTDEGIDIRAYEKAPVDSFLDEEDKDQETFPMEGNRWVVQCKRESEMGPTKVKDIIADGVEDKDPPYGYILVAPVNFSKKSYDVFREALRQKGVMEFYLWGRAELEDLLHMPKNDRILFTFFGISFVSRRKSRTAELRSAIINKNKLYKILGENDCSGKYVLVRDINDNYYPYYDKYADFEKSPKWELYETTQYNSSGVWCLAREYFGYLDKTKKEWDFTNVHDLIYREDKLKGDNDLDYFHSYHAKSKNVEEFWDCLPRARKVKYKLWGLIKFSEILLIDEKGDVIYEYPHLFIDYKPVTGPFSRLLNILEGNDEQIAVNDEEYKRVKIFPETFAAMPNGEIYRDKLIVFDETSLKLFKNGSEHFNSFYDCDNKYDFLKVRDIIAVADANSGSENVFIRITHSQKVTVNDYVTQNGDDHFIRESIKRQAGRDIDEHESITVFEFNKVYAP